MLELVATKNHFDQRPEDLLKKIETKTVSKIMISLQKSKQNKYKVEKRKREKVKKQIE